jgi:choline dehydrogenase
MRARPVDDDELRPLGRAFLQTASESRSLPVVADADYCVPSAGRFQFNIDSGERFNAAFAYLDDVRDSDALTVVPNAVVERLEVANGRFSRLTYRSNGRELHAGGEEVLLCAGAYDTPALLMRSGIGSPEVLEEAGIATIHPARAVGATLFDHPAIALFFECSARLEALNGAFDSPEWMPRWQTFVKERSSRCERTLDLHIYPTELVVDGLNRVVVGVSCMTPKSVGEVRIDRDGLPVVDHRYLSDEHDVDVLVEGIEIVRDVFATPPLADLVRAELAPGAAAETSLREWIRENVAHYFHPVGSCRMGVDGTSAAVDPRGALRGLHGVYVADASVMPTLPDANTNLPVAAIAELLVTSRD